MVSISDVIYAVIKQVKDCIPGSKQYLGNLPENFARPSFLYMLVFNKDTRSSYLTKDTILDLQIIYFGIETDYGKESYDDKLGTMDHLKLFLSKFNLNVKDRNLKFEYGFGEADEQLTINIQFKFKDGIVNPEYDEAQTMEMIERIFVNDKELS